MSEIDPQSTKRTSTERREKGIIIGAQNTTKSLQGEDLRQKGHFHQMKVTTRRESLKLILQVCLINLRISTLQENPRTAKAKLMKIEAEEGRLIRIIRIRIKNKKKFHESEKEPGERLERNLQKERKGRKRDFTKYQPKHKDSGSKKKRRHKRPHQFGK